MPKSDPDKVAAELQSMQQTLKTLEEALRQLTDAFTEEQTAQLSPQAQAGLKRLRNKTPNVKLILPKTATKKKKTSIKTKVKKKAGVKPKKSA